MIRIKNKTQLRKALRKNRKEKYLKINSNGNWHFLKVILLKLKTEKVVLKNSVAIPDKHITKLFKKWESELNKKNQPEIKQDEIKSLKIELCQLKGVMKSKDSQINLLKQEIKNIKREFNKRLISEKEQVLELLKNAEV